jgi:hypothetical protein
MNAAALTITPDSIALHDGLTWDTFGKLETEISASFIVRLCRRKGGWFSFTRAELDAMDRRGRFHWNGLLDPPGMWVVDRGDGTFEVTEAFVCRVATATAPEPAGVIEP